ncbi:MAG: DUF2147 domain-containing protein [Xanthomonadaceae bacterium]|nr:DUF2147 domain-containing protein [Xanthomonadaceae bacterium]
MKLKIIVILLLSAINAFAESPKIFGLWKTEAGNGQVLIQLKEDGTLVGLGAGGGDPNRKDDNNSDPELRGRKLDGAQISWGFKPDSEDSTEWAGGNIYDPDNGKTYSCKMKLDGDVLKIRGYVVIPLFGRTTVWTRVKSP